MSRTKHAWESYARTCLRWSHYRRNDLNEHEIQAVEAALLELQSLPNAKERRIIADEVLIKDYLTLTGAAYRAHVSYHTAKRYSQKTLWLVGKYLGITE